MDSLVWDLGLKENYFKAAYKTEILNQQPYQINFKNDCPCLQKIGINQRTVSLVTCACMNLSGILKEVL